MTTIAEFTEIVKSLAPIMARDIQRERNRWQRLRWLFTEPSVDAATREGYSGA